MEFLSEGPHLVKACIHCVTVCVHEMEELLYAAYKGDLTKVKEIVGQGCPVNVKDKVNCTSTHYNRISLQHNTMKFTVFSFVLIHISKLAPVFCNTTSD